MKLNKLAWFILAVIIFLIFNPFKKEVLFNKEQALRNKYSSIEDVVKKSLEGATGDYAIVVKNLKTKESYFKDEKKSFEPGSLYKLWIMGEAFRQIQKGDLKMDEELSEDIASLNQEFNIEPELAEQTEGTITLSVQDALNQMITISHNYAALLLSKRISLSSVKNYLSDYGFRDSRIGVDNSDPSTTPLDIALFFEKLYKGELVNKEYTQQMVDLLKAQQLNDKLPKYLPVGVSVAHKTGEIDWFSHDGGIVYTNKGDYIIVVFSESDLPSGAEERIALLSKAVYDYFQK